MNFVFDEASVSTLLIGGFAVNSYGVTRQTLDIDFMMAVSDYPKVFETFRRHGFVEQCRQDISSRLKSLKPEWMDVDFMFVERETLEPMLAESRTLEIAKDSFRVPSLQHLIALKLHSLRYNRKIREYKDMLDILKLVERNKISVSDESFKGLCRGGTGH